MYFLHDVDGDGEVIDQPVYIEPEYLAMWPKQDIIRHVVESVAIAVQRGTAMAYLEGYDRALTALGGSWTEENEESVGREDDEEAEREEEEDCDEMGGREEGGESDGERL